MTQYLETAKEIFTWLESLQVKQTEISTGKRENQFCFGIDHPTRGSVKIRLDEIPNGLFVRQGIAFQKTSADKLTVYDAGGIYDPIDGRVQGEHYSTTHFALLGAILFQELGEEHYLNASRAAIEFHLRTSPSEYQPMSEWMYHWDFQNYAFALCYRLLQGRLPDDEKARWADGLRNWQTNHRNTLTNWAGMRAWAFAERRDLLGGLTDGLKAAWNLKNMKKARSSDGCFDDNNGLSRPIQYHIFTVAILHRLLQVQKNSRVKKWFDEGVEYFLPFVDPDGCFNYLGRGHEQIFGYGAAIYTMEAAFKENNDRRCLAAAARMCEHLLRFRRDGHFPLVLNQRPDEERPGWYDYHHLTVYNAFLGAWLGLAHRVSVQEEDQESKRQPYFWNSEPTQTAIVTNDNYFLAFYGGLPEYLCEGGITPHHVWWKDFGVLFSCPGGPTPDRFGKRTPEGQEKNFFAPIAKNATAWFVPARKLTAQLTGNEGSIVMNYDYGPFSVQRKVEAGEKEILVTDLFRFSQTKHYEEFRFFNWPIPVSDLNIVFDAGSSITLARVDKELQLVFSGDSELIEFAEEFVSARGLVQTIVKRQHDFEAVAGQIYTLQFKISQVQ